MKLFLGILIFIYSERSSAYLYLGCFQDYNQREVNYLIHDFWSDITIESGVAVCQSQGYKYAAFQNGF